MVKLSEHFDSNEFACQCGCGFGTHPGDVSQSLLTNLEAIREVVRPLKINSGCRCTTHNIAIGGSALSAHTSGEAADLDCPSSQVAYKLVKAAYAAGFLRIGFERKCIHVDVSKALPQPVLFLYERLDHI